MAQEDADFHNIMKIMGVKPMSEDSAPPPTEQRLPVNTEQQASKKPKQISDDEALFMAALDQNIPNKDDGPLTLEKDPDKVNAGRKKTQIHTQDSLDLHGFKAEEAMAKLNQFITQSFVHNLKTVVIVTGKGKHSKVGEGILRQKVENWIKQKGKRFIRSYAEAPRAFGGKGAFIVNLKDK